ncbi:ATP-binding protein [Methanolobus sp. ZRKC5]|uniref:sensor histidine kinase n=1 Tax=unclassified Methanolobus TaxID=2629569 RepID=UPI00313B73B1
MSEIRMVQYRKSTAQREFIFLVGVGLAVLFVASLFDIFEFTILFIEQHENWELDELFIIGIYLSVALSIFSARRWSEAQAEIKQRKILERELMIAKDEAERSDQSKSEFLVNMSHEIRTLLNAIIGFSDLLLEETFGKLNDKQNKYAKHILNSGSHLLELINQILDLAKIEAGKMELVLEDFIVVEIGNEVKTILETLAHKKGVELVFNVSDNNTIITADKLKIKQAIFNLVSNAIKFTPEKGFVNVNLEIQGGKLYFSVKDSGIGMDKDDLKAIFDPFIQVKSSNNAQYNGTGLGLSITEKIIKLHDGRIWAESVVDEGSIFVFDIPLQ